MKNETDRQITRHSLPTHIAHIAKATQAQAEGKACQRVQSCRPARKYYIYNFN